MNTINTLAWSHPRLLMLVCVLMYALCWVPLLMQRRAQARTTVPSQAFLASFATAPTPMRREPQYATPQALLDACAEAVAHENAPLEAILDECDAELARLSAKIEHFAHTVEQIANGTFAQESPLDEVELALAALVAEIEADERKNAPVTKIEHFASSTARMRAQRAAYAAQGLTARGTAPLPVCKGTTKNGTPCKRKANTGMAVCTAHTDALV